MKNWKFIQVGNKIEISGVAGKLPPDSEISKTIYEELKKNNYDKDKTVLSLSIKYKAIPNPRMFFEDAVEKVIKSYKNRTVNESIDKQTWSMFKGLTKNAEEEIGNSKWEYSDGTVAEVEDDGTVIYTKKDGTLLKQKLWDKEYAEKAISAKGAKKVGNKAIYDDSGRFIIGYVEKNGNGYSAYTHGITGSKSYLLDAKDEKTAESELKDYVKAYEKRTGNKKTGNKFKLGDYVIVTLPGGQRVWGRVLKDDGNVIKYMRVNSNGDEFGPERVATPSEVKAENKKTGNETLGQWAKAKPRIINETKGERKFGKVMGEFERGELKSGSGEKVTDPAQAKAIAYSEADKVDNLKKVRNSKLGWWKLKDGTFAELKHDGRVIYYGTNRGYIEAQEKYDDPEEAEGTLEVSGAKYVGNKEQNVDNLKRAMNAMNKKVKNGKTVHVEGPFKVVEEGGHYIIYEGTKKIDEVPTLDEALDDIEAWLYGND